MEMEEKVPDFYHLQAALAFEEERDIVQSVSNIDDPECIACVKYATEADEFYEMRCIEWINREYKRIERLKKFVY